MNRGEELTESLTKAFELIGESFEEVADLLTERWEMLKGLLNEAEPELIEIPKRNWIVPPKIMLNNQVTLRKPKIVFARSNC